MQENVFRFAIQIKAGRTVLGWSQTELAKRAGIARPTVARIESFTMQPKLETAEKIKDALRNAGIEFSDHQPERIGCPGLEHPSRGPAQEKHQHDRRRRARDQQSRIMPRQRQHRIGQPMVKRGKRDQQAHRQHRSGGCIAKRGYRQHHPRRAGHPAALQGTARHHRHPGHGRAVA